MQLEAFTTTTTTKQNRAKQHKTKPFFFLHAWSQRRHLGPSRLNGLSPVCDGKQGPASHTTCGLQTFADINFDVPVKDTCHIEVGADRWPVRLARPTLSPCVHRDAALSGPALQSRASPHRLRSPHLCELTDPATMCVGKKSNVGSRPRRLHSAAWFPLGTGHAMGHLAILEWLLNC